MQVTKRKRVTNDTAITESALVRFWSKVTKSEGCWDWTGCLDSNGYGLFGIGYTQGRTHRWSLRIHGVELIGGLVVDHLCRNRACVNPGHLRQVTLAENTTCTPAGNKAKTHCRRGHAYSGVNVRITKKGARACRTCQRESMVRTYAKDPERYAAEARMRRLRKKDPRDAQS